MKIIDFSRNTRTRYYTFYLLLPSFNLVPLGIVFAIGKEVYDWFKYGRKLGLVKFLPMALR